MEMQHSLTYTVAVIALTTVLLPNWSNCRPSEPRADPRLLRIDLIIEQSTNQRNMRGSVPFSSLVSSPIQSVNGLDFSAPGGSLSSGGKIVGPSLSTSSPPPTNFSGGKKRTLSSAEQSNEPPKSAGHQPTNGGSSPTSFGNFMPMAFVIPIPIPMPMPSADQPNPADRRISPEPHAQETTTKPTTTDHTTTTTTTTTHEPTTSTTTSTTTEHTTTTTTQPTEKHNVTC